MEDAATRVSENGLSIVLMLTFATLLWAQTFTGWKAYNQEQQEHGETRVRYLDYLTTGHFVEATAENWESEFLQMAAFVSRCSFFKRARRRRNPGRKIRSTASRTTAPARPGRYARAGCG